MTRDETQKIVAIIASSFPSWKALDSDQSLAQLIDVWSIVFKEDDYNAIEAGLLNYIQNDETGFAPSPGQIRNRLKQIVEPYDDTEEAIAELREAVKKGSYHSVAAFENLSPSMQRAVGRAENIRAWASLPLDEFESVVLSHVRRAYRNVKQQEKSIESAMPLKDSMLLNKRDRVERLTQSVVNRLSEVE